MFDVNNQFTGSYYGKDRLGFTTPDAEGSEILRPFLPVPYPAPWLPIRRRDEGHPVGAGVVLSSNYVVGLDASGALVPAGLRSGSTGAGGPAQYLQYGPDDVGFTINPMTGVAVASATETALIACATDADGSAGITVNGVVFTGAQVVAAKACVLIPGGISRPIGYNIRNVFQFLGGVNVTDSSHGILYTLDSMNPAKARVTNYMHEPGTAVQTSMVLRMPWIGATPTTLQTLATNAGLSAGQYTQDDWSRSFVHMCGTKGAADGQFYPGCSVVPSDLNGAHDAGNFIPYDSTKHSFDQICGRVIGVESMYPIRGYSDRVRTQFDRAQNFVGPFAEKNPTQMMMGGSATKGLDYQINIGTKGLLRALLNAGVTSIPAEAATYAWIAFRSV